MNEIPNRWLMLNKSSNRVKHQRHCQILRRRLRGFRSGSERRHSGKEWVLYPFHGQYLADPVVFICKTVTDEKKHDEMFEISPIIIEGCEITLALFELQSRFKTYTYLLTFSRLQVSLVNHGPRRYMEVRVSV